MYRTPEGKLQHGYFCPNCGLPCGMYGHMSGCEQNKDLVDKLRLANPPEGVKARYSVKGVVKND